VSIAKRHAAHQRQLEMGVRIDAAGHEKIPLNQAVQSLNPPV
jgi:hypothetical protein